ncbi:MAG: hypothetical protein LBM59_06980 [Ruminococcus sp.]|jgi:hypothetical protein|nr:hypothetical protein [Ruminococcus sp.]
MDEDYLFPEESESESEKGRKKSRFERDLEKLGSVDAVKAAKTEPTAEGVSMARKQGGSAAVRAALAAAASEESPTDENLAIPYDDISDIVIPELDFITTAPPKNDYEEEPMLVTPIVSQAPVYAAVEPEDDDFSKYILTDVKKSEDFDIEPVIENSDDLSDFNIEDFAVTKAEEPTEDYPEYVPSYPAYAEEEEPEEPHVHLDFASIAIDAFDEEALAEYGRNITFDGEAPAQKFIPPEEDLSALEGAANKAADSEAADTVQEAPADNPPPTPEPPIQEESKSTAPELSAPEPTPVEKADPEPPKISPAAAVAVAAEDLAKIAAAVEADLAGQSDQDELVREREEREASGSRHDAVIGERTPGHDNFDGVAVKTAKETAILEDETAKIKEPPLTYTPPRPVKKIISRHDLNNDVIIEQQTNSLPVLGELGDEFTSDGVRVSGKNKRSDDEISLMRKQEAAAMNVLSEDSSEGGRFRTARMTMDAAEKILARKILTGRIMLYSANALTIIAAIIGIMFFEHDNGGLAFLFRATIVFGVAGFVPVKFLQKVITPFFLLLGLLFVMLGINDAPGMGNIIYYICVIAIMIYSFAVRVFSFDVKELLNKRGF